MYQDNEDDWKILKEYKQKKRNEVNNNKKDYEKKQKLFEKNITETENVIAALKETPGGGQSKRGNIKQKQRFLSDSLDDLMKSKSLIIECEAELKELRAEIAKIDAKIRDIRSKNNEKRAKQNNKKKKAPIQTCPKKCRIENIKVSCKHGRNIAVTPYEPGKPIQEFHVVSTSDAAGVDIIDVRFDSHCDRGLPNSASDSEDYKLNMRLEGSNNFCARTKIESPETQVFVDRPSKTRFQALVKPNKNSDEKIGFLLNRLIFGNVYDAVDYDVSYSSCKGTLPYRTKVIAHPKKEWGVEFTFGYQADYDYKKLRRKFAQNKEKTYDGLKSSGKWAAAIKGNYTYDTTSIDIPEIELTLNELIKELKNKFKALREIESFFEPITAFLEGAMGYDKSAEKRYDNWQTKAKKKNKLLHEGTIGEIDVLWPKLKFNGKYERKELDNGGIGGVGSLVFSFDPLFGITGKIDLIQFLLATLGGTFGKFLRFVCNMELGKKDVHGALEKDGDHFKTNLSLFIGATSNVKGSIGFECNEEKGWHAAASSTGIGGLVGLVLEGKALASGKYWKVVFGVGAEFKTTDESGGKSSGIEINYSPTVINEEFSWAGTCLFNGMAVVWSTYKYVGINSGELTSDEDEQSEGSVKKKKTVVDSANASSKTG